MTKLLPKALIRNFISEIKRVELNRETVSRMVLSFVLIIGLLEPFMIPPKAEAAATFVYYVPDRMTTATNPTGSICVKTATAGTETSLSITFPSTYTINTTLAQWVMDTTSTNIPPGTTAWPTPNTGNATAASNATKKVTWTVGDITSSSAVNCIHFTASGTSVSGAAGNNLTGRIETNIDVVTSDNFATSLVAIGADQVIVTATVAASFTFSLSASTAALLTLPTTGSPNTAAVTMHVSTNAANGWIAWAKDVNAKSSLVSAISGDGVCFGGNYSTCTGAIFAAGAGNVHSFSGAAGYGMSAAVGTGSQTIATEYAGNGTTTFGSLDNLQFEKIASYTAPANDNTTTLTFGAEASVTNKAAPDYTDTVTITAAGQF